MSNVVPLFGGKKASKPAPLPMDVREPISAIMDWAESNGIDIHNNMAFQFRLQDFMSLLRTEVAKVEDQRIA